jgi:hypothetical protein
MNPCRVLVEYRVVSGIGQIIIGVDIALLILSRYCLYNDSCISPDPAFNYLVNPASQLPDLQDSVVDQDEGNARIPRYMLHPG